MSALQDPRVLAFEAASVDPRTFGHREHLYVAWCYLRELPLEAALLRYVHHLRKLSVALGAPGKYHATLTWAYLVLLHDAMADPELEQADFEELARRHPALFDARSGSVQQLYDPSELASERARTRFVLPARRAH